MWTRIGYSIGVASPTSAPSVSRTYATTCPQGVTSGAASGSHPASTARANAAGTSGDRRVISYPEGISRGADLRYLTGTAVAPRACEVKASPVLPVSIWAKSPESWTRLTFSPNARS